MFQCFDAVDRESIRTWIQSVGHTAGIAKVVFRVICVNFTVKQKVTAIHVVVVVVVVVIIVVLVVVVVVVVVIGAVLVLTVLDVLIDVDEDDDGGACW